MNLDSLLQSSKRQKESAARLNSMMRKRTSRRQTKSMSDADFKKRTDELKRKTDAFLKENLPKKFKQKGKSEKKYQNCHNFGCISRVMPVCCPKHTKANGYCRKDMNGCSETGIDKTIRKRDLTAKELAKLRKNMDKNFANI